MPSSFTSSLRQRVTFQFQPILEHDGETPCAYEMLVRQSMPDGTIRGPAELLPCLMSPSRIEWFTSFTLASAMRHLARTRDVPALAVNLSPEQALLSCVEDMVEEAAWDVRKRLIIEITEDDLGDAQRLYAALGRLQASGVRVLLDDITPGNWGERSILRDVIDGVKLDRSVLPTILESTSEADLGAVLWGGVGAGVPIIAEGIEDRSVLTRLRERGIHMFQGFALGEPWSEPVAMRRALATAPLMLGIATSVA